MRRYRIRMVSFRESCGPTSRGVVHGDGWWFEHQVVAPDGRIVTRLDADDQILKHAGLQRREHLRQLERSELAGTSCAMAERGESHSS